MSRQPSGLLNLLKAAGRKRVTLLLFLIPVVAVLVTYRSGVQTGGYYINSDPIRSLLVSQAIIDNGSIRLDEYDGNLINPENDYKFDRINGHLYNHFPVGNSIAAVPFVFCSNLVGRHMSRIDYEAWMHSVLASLSVAGLFVALYFLARVYAGQTASLVIAVSFAFGSPATSTLGSAWWSTNAQLFFLAGALLTIAYRKSGWLLGTLLFAAYLCRPTGAVMIAPAMLVLLVTDRKVFLYSCISLTLWFVVFVVFSQREYMALLPPYYLPGGEWCGIQVNALKGLLVSPSRGLLTFFPQLILLPGAVFFYKRNNDRRHLVLLCVIWPLLLILLISAYPNWWGGTAYGPRLLVETIPAWALLTAAAWNSVSRKARKPIIAVFVLLSMAGIWINLIQGLHNRETALWSEFPESVDSNVSRVFDWSDPQFLVDGNADRFIDYEELKREELRGIDP